MPQGRTIRLSSRRSHDGDADLPDSPDLIIFIRKIRVISVLFTGKIMQIDQIFLLFSAYSAVN